MIDIETEQLIPLRDIPKILPKRSSGKRIHISAVYRWVQRGLAGRTLETVKIGGTRYTSQEAMQRFAEGTDHKRPETTSRNRSSKQRQEALRRASEKARRILGNN